MVLLKKYFEICISVYRQITKNFKLILLAHFLSFYFNNIGYRSVKIATNRGGFDVWAAA